MAGQPTRKRRDRGQVRGGDVTGLLQVQLVDEVTDGSKPTIKPEFLPLLKDSRVAARNVALASASERFPRERAIFDSE